MNELKTLWTQIGKRNWWIIALTAGAALLISIGLSLLTKPTYQTSARFIVSPSSELDDRDIIDSLEALDKRTVIVTYAEVLRSNRIFDAARQTLNTNASDLDDYELTAVVLPEANVLELTVTGSDPNQVASLANAIGEQAIEYMSSLYPVHLFNFLDRAAAPQRPFAPQLLQNAILSVALGLGVGVLLVIFRERVLPPTPLLTHENAAAPENDGTAPLTDTVLENNQPTPTNGSVHDFQTTSSKTS